jgi:anti-sigma B factor antagonist
MHLAEKIANDVAVVSIKGDLLDENDDAILQQEIRSLITDDVKKVIMDLGKVNRINSRGLGILISAVNTLRRVGGDLRLARIDKRLHDILAITKLVQIFRTYERVEGALASYRN